METGCSNGSIKRMHWPNSGTKQVDIDSKPKHYGEGASFIKLLGRDFSKELQIPHEFTMIFNGYVPHRFIIESSALNKKCFRVEVQEEGDGTMYFREGWPEFVEAHSLGIGNFLLFMYEEQSIFQVKIYDKNGCERSTIAPSPGGKHKPVKIVDVEAEAESESLKAEPQRRTNNRSLGHKLKMSTRKYENGKRRGAYRRSYIRTAKVLSVSGTATSFSVKIHKFKVHQFFQLTFPKAISTAKKLYCKNEVTVQDAAGNCWPVKLAHRTDGRVILSHGWKSFIKANKVEHGDTLSFEFLSDILVQCRVTKSSQVEQETQEAELGNGAAVAAEATDFNGGGDSLAACTANGTAPEVSCTKKWARKVGLPAASKSTFSFMWRPTTVGTYLHIPKIVIKGQQLMNKTNVVLRDPEGKCWPMEVAVRRDGRVALTTGWVEFWKGHGIKAGDSLYFEFLSDYLVQVAINRRKPLHSPVKFEEEVMDLRETDNEILEPATQPELEPVLPDTVMAEEGAMPALPEFIDMS